MKQSWARKVNGEWASWWRHGMLLARYLTGPALLLLFLIGCSATPTVKIYHTEGAQVRIYNSRAVMYTELPDSIAMHVLPLAAIGVRVNGYYDQATKTVYSIDDPKIIAHELRHHHEGNFHSSFEDLSQQ